MAIPDFQTLMLPVLKKAADRVVTMPHIAEEQIDAAYGVLNAAVKTDLLQRVLDNTPSFFERLIVDLLVGMGLAPPREYSLPPVHSARMRSSMCAIFRNGWS